MFFFRTAPLQGPVVASEAFFRAKGGAPRGLRQALSAPAFSAPDGLKLREAPKVLFSPSGAAFPLNIWIKLHNNSGSRMAPD